MPASERARVTYLLYSLAANKRKGRANAKRAPRERELVPARTRNCGRTNAKLFPHEREFILARTRNRSRTITKWGTNSGTKCDTKCGTKCRTKLLHEISVRVLQAVSGFWEPSRALANESGESILGPFRAAILGGNSGAISRGQFRAGNFVRAISRGQFRAPASFFRPPVLVGCRRRGGSPANGAPSPSPPPKSASPSSSPAPWSSSPSVVAAAVVVVIVADDGRPPATAEGLRRLPTGPGGSAHVVSFHAFGQER